MNTPTQKQHQQTVPFVKYTALGNDYAVIHPRDLAAKILTVDWIRRFCDRHWGVGSDGILFGPTPVGANPYGVRIFNPDGSEAEKSGNGLRIFSQYLKDQGLTDGSAANSFLVHTKGGEVRVQYLAGDLIQIDMGQPAFVSPDFSPQGSAGELRERWQQKVQVLDREFLIHCVSMGNPHCVVVMKEKPLGSDIKKYGTYFENHAFFPQKINLQFAWAETRKRLQLEIWERGAGYTLASGSSSCAAAAVCRRLDLIDAEVEVVMPGGSLQIAVQKELAQVRMTGVVERVFAGTYYR